MTNSLEWERPVIAITGTSGKTTVKEMVASILQTKWNTFKSRENGNDLWFTSQYAQQINESHEAVVLEFGLSQEGDLDRHCQLIQPHIGVITNVGLSHIDSFTKEKQKLGVQQIAKEKSRLIQGMNSHGTLFVNADDPNSKLLDIVSFQGKVVRTGLKNEADYKAIRVAYSENGMLFSVIMNHTPHSFSIPLYGEHNVHNALFAIALSYELGFSIEEIRRGLETFEKPKGRVTVSRFHQNITLINDCFNSKPCGAKAAIDVLASLGQGTKVAVLGCTLNIGIHSKDIHYELGRYIAARDIDYLYTVNKGQRGRARLIAKGAIEHGFPPEKARHFADLDNLYQTLVEQLEPDMTILIKGRYGNARGRNHWDTWSSLYWHLSNLYQN
ncbi:UDP-N-acetylmuramoyl-tripeptide--D-alanyl-D-alanine ligase [Aneurinibacillus tyrosinisolvens]|uniref:UDP-N-acetylmuramoyl-tripeptide--D-alanyl-D- alanine ligase n=1 Tax=Aneurinibacillus tyrosinisolvens TaxID=1443435 RepID=UPI00069A7CF9|nr:UDP-N-acetylmuramoyl-tripeptide--D-alanyl-D-alanine ligase [Aneurinibacillus tyrosinisolvens]